MSLRPAISAITSLAVSSSSSTVIRAARISTPLLVKSKRALSTITPKSPSSSSYRKSIASSSRLFSSCSKSLAPNISDTPASSPGIVITELTSSQYEDISERDMEVLNESLEELCEDLGGGEWEVEYSSGVLNLSLPPHGHYVVNKQPPNQQIWISSPISGPSRFGYSGSTSGGGTWVHHRREGVTLGGLLDKELKEILEGSSITGEWQGTGLK